MDSTGIGGVLNGFGNPGVGERRLFLGKVPVEPASGLLHGVDPGEPIHMLHKGGGVQPTGAVAYYDLRPSLRQELCQLAQKGGMRCCGGLRFHGGDQIGLNDNVHTGEHKVQPT